MLDEMQTRTDEVLKKEYREESIGMKKTSIEGNEVVQPKRRTSLFDFRKKI